MKEYLVGKTILIVGAGGLLGREIMAAALSQGAKVIAAEVDIDRLEQSIPSSSPAVSSGSLTLQRLDITQENDVRDFFSSVPELDGAVNCSYPRGKGYGAHFFDVSLAGFNENLALNLGSAFLFAQQCAAYFEKNKAPFSLVNVSSIYGVVAPRFSVYENTNMTMPVEYAAIKSALVHLSKYVAAYIGDSDFRVNCVSPGGILDGQPHAFLDAYKNETHGAGMLQAKSMVGTILFLLSEHSKYMVGQNLIVDDGFCL